MFICGFRKIFLLILLSCLVLIMTLLIPQIDTTINVNNAVSPEPPLISQNLICTSISQNTASLKWSFINSEKLFSEYLIYKDSTYIASTTSTSYTVSGLIEGTNYSFYIKAKDLTGNISSPSNELSVRTVKPKTIQTQIAPPQTTMPIQTQTEPPQKQTEPPKTQTAPPQTTTPTQTLSSNKVIVGYYASWAAYNGYTPINIPASKLTHINYAFAKIGNDLTIALGDPNVDPTNFAKLNELKKTYPNIKTLISIGGWEWSGKFSDAALTDSSRTIFADSIITFIKQYGFNGVDIDWEYPVSGGLPSNIKRPEDKKNYTLLLKKIRDKLNAQSSLDGQKYLLSIAGGAGSFFTSNTEPSIFCNYIDYANIMAYDSHGPWDTYTDFNAPLYNPKEASPQYKSSADSAVKSWISAGFPSSKIVLGVPFYGYIYSGVTNSNNGLYQKFSKGNSITYDKIVSDYLSNSSFVKYNHPDAAVSWLFNGSEFITYDNEQSLSEKAKYIISNKLAGVSIWELSQNKNGVLLNTLYANLK